MNIFELRQELIEHRDYVKDRVSRMDSREQVYEFIMDTHAEYMTKQEGHENEYQTAKILTDIKKILDVKVEINNGTDSKEFEFNDALLNFSTPSRELNTTLEKYRQGVLDEIKAYTKLIDLAFRIEDCETFKHVFNTILNSKETYELSRLTFTVDNSIKLDEYNTLDDLEDGLDDIKSESKIVKFDISGQNYKKWSKLGKELQNIDQGFDLLSFNKIITYNTLTVLDELQNAHVNKKAYYDYFGDDTEKKANKYKNVETERKFFINLALYLCMKPIQTENFLQLNGFNLSFSILPDDRLLLALIELNLDLEAIDMVMTKMEYKGLKLGKSRRKTSNTLIDEYKLRIINKKAPPLSAAEEYKYQIAYQQEINKIDRFLEQRERLVENETDKAKIESLRKFKEKDFRKSGDNEWTLAQLKEHRNTLINNLKSLSGYYGNHDIDIKYTQQEIKNFDNSIDNIIKRSDKALNKYNSKLNKLTTSKEQFEKEKADDESYLEMALKIQDGEEISKEERKDCGLPLTEKGINLFIKSKTENIARLESKIKAKEKQITAHENKKTAKIFKKKFYTFETLTDEYISIKDLEKLNKELVFIKGQLL